MMDVGARRKWYFILMSACLTLIVLAWFWVRLWSVPLAIAMSVIAALLSPVASLVANRGVVNRLRFDSSGRGVQRFGAFRDEDDL